MSSSNCCFLICIQVSQEAGQLAWYSHLLIWLTVNLFYWSFQESALGFIDQLYFGGTPLVIQWLRTHLPMQETQVRSLIWEDSTCCGATKPMCQKKKRERERESKPMCHNYWSPSAFALQQEEPPHWEVHTLQLESSPDSLQLEKGWTQQQRPSTATSQQTIFF